METAKEVTEFDRCDVCQQMIVGAKMTWTDGRIIHPECVLYV